MRYALIWIVLIAFAGPCFAVDKPTTVITQNSCVTADCHADVKDHDVLHGPVNVNACDACHTQVDVKEHTFKLAREKKDLCTFCHVIEVPEGATVHEPLTTHDCLGCHDPHGGFDRNTLKKKTMSELCASCHQDVTANMKFIHGPVAAGACAACHKPHASMNPYLLVDTGTDLCFGCHTEMKQQLQTADFVHDPVLKDCRDCHNAHGSNYPMFIKDKPATLCTSCHEDVKAAVNDAKYKHSAVTQDRACINCHTPHGGDLAKLMKDTQVDLCLACHNKAVTTPDGRTIASVSEITDPKLFKHGPIAQGTCGGCHDVHGSEYAKLLNAEYPATFYQPFDIDSYKLCFECHDQQLVLNESAQGLTNFRNGDTNLHYVHVNKAERGRSCRACHSVHASTLALHMRETVPYGKWELPINYKQTNNGGSCAPGCHQFKAYDRDNPVDYTLPETEPEPETEATP